MTSGISERFCFLYGLFPVDAMDECFTKKTIQNKYTWTTKIWLYIHGNEQLMNQTIINWFENRTKWMNAIPRRRSREQCIGLVSQLKEISEASSLTLPKQLSTWYTWDIIRWVSIFILNEMHLGKYLLCFFFRGIIISSLCVLCTVDRSTVRQKN